MVCIVDVYLFFGLPQQTAQSNTGQTIQVKDWISALIFQQIP